MSTARRVSPRAEYWGCCCCATIGSESHLPFYLPYCGLVVRQGASCGGDDALALIISKTTRLKISQAYLFTDITVLALSLSYIPVRRIVYSLVTVTISSYLIDIVTTFGRDKDEKPNSEAVPE